MGGYTISFSKLLVLIGTTISQLESAPVLLSGGVSQIKSPSVLQFASFLFSFVEYGSLLEPKVCCNPKKCPSSWAIVANGYSRFAETKILLYELSGVK